MSSAVHIPPRARPRDGQPCFLLVGPEGDFTPSELAALTEAGALPVGLGPHRLRTETAALSLLSAAVAFADEAEAAAAG